MYSIETVDIELAGGGEGTITAEFRVTIANIGGSGGLDTVSLSLAVDGQELGPTQEIPRPQAGSHSQLMVTTGVEPKLQTVLVTVGNADREITLDARVPDIVLTPLKHTAVASGSLDFEVELANVGSVVARDVVITAELTPAQEQGEGPTSVQRSAIVETLPPEQSLVVPLRFDAPTGRYVATLAAESGTPEALLDNNHAEAHLDVEYVDLVPLLQEVNISGYRTSGDGVVRGTVQVSNNGLAPSGTFDIGVVCPDSPEPGCTWSSQMESIPPGQTSEEVLTFILPQGESTISVFAGALEDGYRWGDANVQEVTVDVPFKDAVELVMNAEANIGGYWSNGNAEVEVTASLLNEGYAQVDDSQMVAVSCLRDEEVLSDCGGDLPIHLAEGFGPTAGSLGLTAPMGTTLNVSLPGEEQGIQLKVPDRILGVDPYIWECYSDRPGHRDGCGGWRRETIDKWEIDRPVKLWRTGSADYLAISLPVLRELTSLLGLEFELVESEEEADVKAYFGVPRSTALDLGWPSCEDAAGCASWSLHDHRVTRGIAAVWHQEAHYVTFEFVRAVILHEMLHVMVPIGHRQAFDTRLATDHGLSVIDEEMIRLHVHPLIEAGMSISEVRDVIVLNEDLLDPQPLSPYREVHEAVRQATRVLQEAESVRFQVSGEWRGTCGPNPVGPGVYEVADIEGIAAGSVRYREGEKHYLILNGTEHWSESRGRWEETDGRDIFDATYWAPTHPNPFTILTSILALGNDKNISVVSRSGGKIVIKTSSPLTERVANTSLTINDETHQIEGYEEQIRLRRGCRLVFRGEMGEYNIGFEIPSEIT